MGKLKKYGLILSITILTVIILDIITVILNIDAQFFIGWFGASVYLYATQYYDGKESENKMDQNDDIIHILTIENNDLNIENEKLKTDRDYYKSRFENLKSDNIVNDSINK